MLDTILSEEALKSFVVEMRTSITNYGFGDPKSRDYILLQEFQYHPMVCCLIRLGQVGVRNQQNLYPRIPTIDVAKLLQYNGSRVEHRDGFSS